MDKSRWAISTVLATLAIIVPILLFLSTQSDKSLTYQVISKTELVGTIDSVEDIEIKIRGEIVHNAAIYLLKIHNSGTDPIKPRDFEKPIVVKHTDETIILNVHIKNKSPDNISVNHRIEGSSISIDPLLLNPDDSFEVEVLSTSQEFPIIDSRIAGIKSVEILLPDETKIGRKIFLLTISILLLIFYSKSFYHAISKGYGTSSRVINFTLGATCGFSSAHIVTDFIDLEGNYFIQIFAIFVTVAVGILLAKFDNQFQTPTRSELDTPIDIQH